MIKRYSRGLERRILGPSISAVTLDRLISKQVLHKSENTESDDIVEVDNVVLVPTKTKMQWMLIVRCMHV